MLWNSKKVLLLVAFFACSNKGEEGKIEASGTLEAVVVRVAPLVSGQIVRLNVVEGENVSKDDLLALVDDRHIKAQIAQAEAALQAADAGLRLVKKGVRKEDINALQEQVRQAREAYEQAVRERDRAKKLLEQKAIPQKTYEDAETMVAVREAGLRATQELLKKARTGARQEEIEVAMAQRNQAEAALNLLKERLRDYAVYAPISGTVMQKYVEEGEVIGQGQPICALADLSVLELRVYVKEKDLGRIRLGQDVKVFVDAFEDKAFQGKITYVSSQAEFTPKNIQTKEERVKTVYAVKVMVANKEGLLKVGMPADAIIETSP
jgi:HlyD family secretion protein